MTKRKHNRHPALRFVFLVYMALMLWLLFGRSHGWVEGLSYEQMLWRSVNFTPFFTINNYLKVILQRTNDRVYVHCFINLVGNVVMFIPPGWLLPGIWRSHRNFFQFIATCLAVILFIELAQLLTLLGSFDVDDVILNMSGLLIGYLAYILTHRKKK